MAHGGTFDPEVLAALLEPHEIGAAQVATAFLAQVLERACALQTAAPRLLGREER